MSEVLASLKQKGGSGTLKEIYKNLVFNGGYTTYSFTPFNSRSSINEGGVAVDTVNHTVYLYIDFSILITQPSTGNYDLADIQNFNENYMPLVFNLGSSLRGDATLTTDDGSSVPTKKWVIHKYSSSSIGIAIPYGQGVGQGENYIVYGSWKY